MAERNPKLKKYRDGLEIVINRAMEYVEAAYQTIPSHDTGITSHLQAQNNQLSNPVTTPESITGLEPHMQPLYHGQPQEIRSEVYDFQIPDFFSEIPGLPSNLQSIFSRDHADMLDTTFQGAFPENLWATEIDTSFLEEGAWNL
ncbi:Zn(II)2Cys6 transcription factor [Penicillium herquei]|nr:Zn(II)2Cys6 transcription factor [Penicillium herquei]